LAKPSFYTIIYLGLSKNTLEYCCGVKKGVCRMVRKVLLLVVLIVVVFSFIGCQTVQGLGEDIKWTGEKGAEVVNQE
jgi:predicted small secreted protein